jgi:hypothetical protein
VAGCIQQVSSASPNELAGPSRPTSRPRELPNFGAPTSPRESSRSARWGHQARPSRHHSESRWARRLRNSAVCR